MKLLLTVTLVLAIVGLSCGQRGDTLRDENHYYYLADVNLRAVGQLILKDSIMPTDNHITFRCMDSIKSKRKETRDYFFPVFIKIIDKADGALAEVVGGYALGYSKGYPQELADRYKCCTSTQTCCTKLTKFSGYVSAEIRMGDDPKAAYDALLGEMTRNFGTWRTNKTLKIFIDNVDYQ